MNEVEPGRKYMQFLPSVFHEREKDDTRPFIERYLKIFERIISGIEDGELKGKKGIAQTLDIIPDIFHPRFSFLFDETEKKSLPPLKTNEKIIFKNYFRDDVDVDEFLNEFLRWLASWMALVLKEDWDLEKKREVIARIIPIYRMRGTKRGLEEYLKIYVGKHITIIDEVEPFKIGITSHVGKKGRIGGLPPYFFIVEVDVTYMFRWDRVPGKDGERLLNYLRDDFGIDWADSAKIHKCDDDRTIEISIGKNSAEIVMDENKEKAILTINGGKTLELKVRKENRTLTLYNVKNIRASDIKKWKAKKKAIEEIINSEKPAHTEYWLDIKHPRMILGVRSMVGENTLL